MWDGIYPTMRRFTAIANQINKYNNEEIANVDFVVCDGCLKESRFSFDHKKCNGIYGMVCDIETNRIAVYKHIDS